MKFEELITDIIPILIFVLIGLVLLPPHVLPHYVFPYTIWRKECRKGRGGPICLGFCKMRVKMIENETGELVPNPAYNREEDGDYTCCHPCCGIPVWDEDVFKLTIVTAQATTGPAPIQLQSQSNPAPFMNQVAPQQQTLASQFAQVPPLAPPDGPPTYDQSAYAPPNFAPPAYEEQDW